ncbi:hypothetical protein [Streptomyces sp. NPDC015125]
MAPDLPSVLWQQILRDVIGQSAVPSTAPPASHAAPLVAIVLIFV